MRARSPRAARLLEVIEFSGMAADQAEAVHQNVVYDLEVDTTHAEAFHCAEIIAASVR